MAISWARRAGSTTDGSSSKRRTRSWSRLEAAAARGASVAIVARSATISQSQCSSLASAPLGDAHLIELGECRLERRDDGRVLIGSGLVAGDHDARLREHEREVGPREPEPGRGLGEHLVRAACGIGVDPGAGQCAFTCDMHGDRHRTALDGRAHANRDRFLDRRRDRHAAQLEVEEPVVDRAHVDRGAHAAHIAMPRPYPVMLRMP
jgi:hypothetical protein